MMSKEEFGALQAQQKPTPRPAISEAIARVEAQEASGERDEIIEAIATNAVDALMRHYKRHGYGATDVRARRLIIKALQHVPDGDLLAASTQFATSPLPQATDPFVNSALEAFDIVPVKATP